MLLAAGLLEMEFSGVVNTWLSLLLGYGHTVLRKTHVFLADCIGTWKDFH